MNSQRAPAGDKALAVLVVEDNPDARDTLRLLLELEGHRVQAVDSGEGGVAAARSSAFDVALVDIGLPDLDGYDVARQIRTIPRGGQVYLVALTGYGQPDDRKRALESGFDAHLVKPVDPDDLLKLLSGLRGGEAAS
jgi:CheY-like chemotaxis protein